MGNRPGCRNGGHTTLPLDMFAVVACRAWGPIAPLGPQADLGAIILQSARRGEGQMHMGR